MTDQSVETLHGDRPSAFSPKGLEHRKELSTIAFERTRMPMVMVDARAADQPIVLANKAFLELSGYAAHEVIGRNCRFLQGPDTSQEAVTMLRETLAEQREANIELLNYRKDGSPFWNQLYVSPIHDDNGELAYFFASQIDITEQRRVEALEAAEHRLLKEVDHRAKNVMAIVESIVRLSDASDTTLYAAAIQQRVQALSRLHGLLADHGWNSIRFEDVVRQQVSPFAENRVTMEGPMVMIPALLVQPLGLAIHELMTNATQHGSLSAGHGRLHIDWDHPLHNGFTVHWREDGTDSIATETGKGFGNVLISAMIERQLGGSLARDWRPEGLALQMAVPLPAV